MGGGDVVEAPRELRDLQDRRPGEDLLPQPCGRRGDGRQTPYAPPHRLQGGQGL